MRIYVVAAAVLLQASAALAVENFGGKIISVSPFVKVLTAQGAVAEYAVTSVLDRAYLFSEGSALELSQGGVTSRCPPYLGDLAEDFSVTVELNNGTQKEIEVTKSTGRTREVRVYGTCGGERGELTELHFNVGPRGQTFKVTNVR
jgi:hypothetical protein